MPLVREIGVCCYSAFLLAAVFVVYVCLLFFGSRVVRGVVSSNSIFLSSVVDVVFVYCVHSFFLI